MMRPIRISQTFKQGAHFLLALRSDDPDQRSRELALRTVFLGTFGLTAGALLIVCINYFALHLHYLLLRIIIIGVVALLLLSLYGMILRRRFTLPAFCLLLIYFTAATGAAWLWGVETPIGTLLFVLVVIFSGILLGARYALYAALLAVGIQGLFVVLLHKGIAHPNLAWAATPARLYDVLVFAIILSNIALVSWLFNRSMEQSLARAQHSEHALLRQKALLEVKIEERTRQVQAAQLEHMQELYRFAELGHMSLALLHDMANYLTVLSLDIEDLRQTRKNRSTVLGRVQQSTRHLNSLIKQVRNQIQGETAVAAFNVADEINQIIKILEYKASSANVHFEWEFPPTHKALAHTGSVSHFRQIMMNSISNGIDAYVGHKSSTQKVVRLSAKQNDAAIVITITDFGKGVPADHLQKIFEPFYSTKKNGTGVGLSITKHMVEKDFGGKIAVTSDKSHGTTFTITLPIRH